MEQLEGQLPAADVVLEAELQDRIDELTGIGTTEELQISGRRRDGTLHNPRTIWVVRVGDDL
jgi:hypothetical protein